MTFKNWTPAVLWGIAALGGLPSAFGQLPGEIHARFETGAFTDNSVLALAGSPREEIYGVALGATAAQTTGNGYVFSEGGSANVDFDGAPGSSAGPGGAAAAAATGDPGFDAVLAATRSGPGSGSLVLKNLAQGTPYRVLFLVSNTGPGIAGRPFSVTQGEKTSAELPSDPGGKGGYVVCTFTASGMTESFTVNGLGGALKGVLVCCVGANTPFKTIEAEWGTLGGGASLVTLDKLPPARTEALEASGHGYVRLAAAGDSVTLTNNTGITSNTVVARVCIPDAPDGGGISATLDLYVDGVFRQALSLSSACTWNYGDWYNDLPTPGKAPLRFFETTRAFVTGAPIPPGSTIMLKKGDGNAADYYDVDCVDLESVGPPKERPENTLSVTDYGAVPDDGIDAADAFQKCFQDAEAQKKGVWIPAGTFRTDKMLVAGGITIGGAGMWYTTLYRQMPLPNLKNVRSKLNLKNCTVRDLYIDGNANGRKIPQGADYGMTMGGADGWLVERVWVHNTAPSFWMTGSNGMLRDCRSENSWADGINLNNGGNPDSLGLNLTAENNFIRSANDDGIAINAQNGQGPAGNMVGTRVVGNTSIAVAYANGLRIAGGRDTVLENNYVTDTATNDGIIAATFGKDGNPLESALIRRNVVLRLAGTSVIGRGGICVEANATGVEVSGNIVQDSFRAGLVIFNSTGTYSGNVIDHPAEQGIFIRPGAAGGGTFTGNIVENLLPGQPAFQKGTPSTFNVTASGNTGF